MRESKVQNADAAMGFDAASSNEITMNTAAIQTNMADPSPMTSVVSKGRPTNSSSSDRNPPRAEAVALAAMQEAATILMEADQKKRSAEAHCSRGYCDNDIHCCEDLVCSDIGYNEVESGNNCYCYKRTGYGLQRHNVP